MIDALEVGFLAIEIYPPIGMHLVVFFKDQDNVAPVCTTVVAHALGREISDRACVIRDLNTLKSKEVVKFVRVWQFEKNRAFFLRIFIVEYRLIDSDTASDITIFVDYE